MLTQTTNPVSLPPPYNSLPTPALFADPSCGARTCIPLSIHSFYAPVAIASPSILFVSSDLRFQGLRVNFLPEKKLCNYSVMKITIIVVGTIPAGYPSVAVMSNLMASKVHGVIDRVTLLHPPPRSSRF